MDTSETRQKMIRILKEFITLIAVDKEMVDFARGKNMVFLFTMKDMDPAFFLNFIDGKVDAGLGSPPHEPDVILRMDADILDGMFTGRVNPIEAAASGDISFSGNASKAMAFIRIQDKMSRLYSEARIKAGAPGNPSTMAATPALAAAPLPAAPTMDDGTQAGTVSSLPVNLKTHDVRDQILQITKELYAKGLITSTGGNISARCDDNPNEVWITPSAVFKGDLRSAMMVRIDLEGRIINETAHAASSERRVHCEIYRNLPDIRAVIHTHAPYATLMALTGTHFQPISADAAFFGDIPVVPFIMPGTDELGKEVAKAMLQSGLGVLMQNHGLVVAGTSLRRAADMSEIIESTAHKLITCRMLGVEPVLLTEGVVRELKGMGKSMA